MADEIAEIRARIDIVDLVSQRVALKRAGKHWKGLCPFHQDRNPSFSVSPEMGRYRCWSCGEAGDVFNWVMKTQNVDFAEALQTLAKQAGVKLTSRNPEAKAERTHRLSAMEAALAFFRQELGRSPVAKEYCSKRSIDEATIDSWELGYAPDVGEALTVHLKRGGYSLAECKTLFLVDEDGTGGYFDKFRGRLIFPIRDEKGDLVAFGGRILGDGHPKYINSGDTPIYRKSRVLYGMQRARDSMSRIRRAVLVEGYLDVIACHRAGVSTAIASLGTALAEDHAKLLKRWCDEVVVLYDADEAGEKAASRACEVLRAESLKVRVALMPPGEDPDTLLRTAGPAAVVQAAEGGMSPLDYEIHALKKRLEPSQEEFWSQAAAVLAKASSGLEIERHIEELAALYPGIRDQVAARQAIRNQVSALRRRAPRRGPAVDDETGSSGPPRATALSASEEVVLVSFLSDDQRRRAWEVVGQPEAMETALGADLCLAIRQAFPEGPPTGPAAVWLPDLESESARSALADLEISWGERIAQKLIAEITPAVLEDAVEALAVRLRDRMKQELKQGEWNDDKLREFTELQKGLYGKNRVVHRRP